MYTIVLINMSGLRALLFAVAVVSRTTNRLWLHASFFFVVPPHRRAGPIRGLCGESDELCCNWAHPPDS